MSLFPSRIGRTRVSMSAPLYWLSASVYDVVHAPAAGNLHRVVPGAVVDDQVLDYIDPVNMFRQVVQGDLKGLRLIQAGDLDD